MLDVVVCPWFKRSLMDGQYVVVVPVQLGDPGLFSAMEIQLDKAQLPF